MKTETTATATPSTNNIKNVVLTVEFTVPVSTTVSILGGKSKGAYSKDQQYARFYLNQAIRRLNGRVVSQKDAQ